MTANAIKITRPDSLLNFSGQSRLPIVMQTEVAECGLACLAMIAGYYGFDTDMTSLRRNFAISSKGTNLKTIMEIASRLHLSPRALRVESEDLDHIQLPCILHWGLNHFVVLKAIHKNRISLHDPAFGERSIEKSEFNKEFTGIALELTPTSEFAKGENKQQLKLRDFWSKIIGLKRSLAHVLALSLLLQIFSLVAPFYMQIVVDDVLLRKDTNLLFVLALGFGLLTLIKIGTNVLREFIILQFSYKLAMQISSNLFRHLIRLNMDYFARRHMGDVISRFGSLERIRDLLTHSLVAAIIDGIMAIITMIAMFFYSAKLALIVVSTVFVYGCIRWVFFRPFKLLNEESIISAAKENSHFMESIRAIQTIKLFQRENDRQNQWQNRLADSMNKNIRISKWGIAYGTVNGFLFSIESLAVTTIGAIFVMDSLISLGMLYAFLSYKGSFIGAMDSLISKWVDFKMLDLHLNRLADIVFSEKENIENHTNSEATTANDQQKRNSFIHMHSSQPQKIMGKIEVRNLAFKYSENESFIFKDLSFTIKPGETVAITGASGCGKTTLLKCLMGFIQPTSGEIFIDDVPLKSMPHYRSQIAGVMQDDQLLSGDIAENISCFAPSLIMEKVETSAKMACIHFEILKMPMQYHTLVGDMGSNLSGGQKQRVVLARALYREPRILFMDEATSHLDTHNESKVNDQIKHLDITRVLVAHRSETVRSADRQINLNDYVNS